MEICVPERGHTDIDSTAWALLEASPEFRRIHARGVVEVAYRPDGMVRLRGTCFVGNAMCGSIALICQEKVRGALGAMLKFASQRSFQPLAAQGASTNLTGLIDLLVLQFLDTVTKYASSGRQFAYQRRRDMGSLIGGRLDVTRSLRLRARGLGHLFIFDRQTASFSTPVNRSVLAALVEIERLGHLIKLSETVRARARALSMLFDDNRRDLTFVLARGELAETAYSLSLSQPDDLTRDMMALASVVLAHESFDPQSTLPSGLPRTWFLNLERLFEAAVRNVLRQALEGSVVFRGEDHPQAIFNKVTDRYFANPDVVVLLANGALTIFDVKYKVYDGHASASDLYQLLAHASAFGANFAALLFPTEEFTVRELGSSRSGVAVSIFGVRVENLADDLSQVAKLLDK